MTRMMMMMMIIMIMIMIIIIIIIIIEFFAGCVNNPEDHCGNGTDYAIQVTLQNIASLKR
jgi:uncharacterized membrane protein